MSGAPGIASPEDSTEEACGHATEPINTRELQRRVLPFEPSGGPFPVHATAASPTVTARHDDPADETALLPASGARRRLVRFDPQTGKPLARPYWEDLPPVAKSPR